MIQRIQSVYLFIGALLLAPIVVFHELWVSTVATLHAELPRVVYILAAIGGLLGFVAVFLYKNRERQARIIAVVQWLDLALILLIVVTLAMLSFSGTDSAPSSPLTLVVLCLPAAAYILFSLARRAVKKDIKLVRSMDRLR